MTIQEELEKLYWRVVFELGGSWDMIEAFHALSEIIEYNGGGKHINYRGSNEDA